MCQVQGWLCPLFNLKAALPSRSHCPQLSMRFQGCASCVWPSSESGGRLQEPSNGDERVSQRRSCPAGQEGEHLDCEPGYTLEQAVKECETFPSGGSFGKDELFSSVLPVLGVQLLGDSGPQRTPLTFLTQQFFLSLPPHNKPIPGRP